MSFIFSNDLLVAAIFAFCIFMVSYLNIDKLLNFIHKKSFGTEEEVLGIMNKMLIETDPKKVTTLVWLLSVGLGLVVFLLLWPNFVLGLVFSIIVALAGWSIPKFILKSLWESRSNKVVYQMVDGLTIISNGVKSGLTVAQSMERVTENMKGPFPQELNLILNKLKLGMSMEDALNEFAQRIERDDVQMLVTSINILKETGGNMAETFETITFTIRERQKILKKIEALTTGSVWQGIIISSVPFVLLIFFSIMDPDYIAPLFNSFIGWIFLGMIAMLQLIGGLAMKKVITIKV
ncbi:MAG: hypothetical protein HOO06_02140 [Bdellovibrionaceae bacterium]|jgi:tight adherence protein B|nr:hypothetical protein [Pseudobdellovibrionaceae bacterium]